MNYLLLIHHGIAPTLDNPKAWASLSEEEQKALFADYQAISQTPGVTPGPRMQAPEMATTVRVQDWTRRSRSPRIPAARLGGGVEIRPLG